jgi:uncharacterized membrane protein
VETQENNTGIIRQIMKLRFVILFPFIYIAGLQRYWIKKSDNLNRIALEYPKTSFG